MKSLSAQEINEIKLEDVEPDPQSLISPRYFEPNHLLQSNTDRNQKDYPKISIEMNSQEKANKLHKNQIQASYSIVPDENFRSEE